MRYLAAVVTALTLLVSSGAPADRGGEGGGDLHGHHGDAVELNGVVTRAPDASGTAIVSERPIVVEGTTIVQEGGRALKSPEELKRGCSVAVRGFEQAGLLVAREIIVRQC